MLDSWSLEIQCVQYIFLKVPRLQSRKRLMKSGTQYPWTNDRIQYLNSPCSCDNHISFLFHLRKSGLAFKSLVHLINFINLGAVERRLRVNGTLFHITTLGYIILCAKASYCNSNLACNVTWSTILNRLC